MNQKKTILIVEDEMTSQKAMSEKFIREGFLCCAGGKR